MKSRVLMAMLAIAAFISSCQKESQAPTSSKPEVDLQNSNLALTTLSSSTMCNTINSGLIAFYPFLGNANDVSGHGHNGELISRYGNQDGFLPPILTTNKFGLANQAYRFDGQSSYILITSPFKTNVSQTQFSFYVRCKANSVGTLISNNTAFGLNQPIPFFALEVTADSSVSCTWTDSPGYAGGAFVQSAPVSLGQNCWMDVVVNFSNNVLTLYVNGKLAATTTTGFPSPAIFDPYFYIGLQFEGFGGALRFFNSVIDEERIYNRPLTTTEISYLLAH